MRTVLGFFLLAFLLLLSVTRARAEEVPPGQAMAFFNCGKVPVRTSWLEPQRIILERGEKIIALGQIPSPPGTEGIRFRTLGREDEQVVFWVIGRNARLIKLNAAGQPVSGDLCERVDLPRHEDAPYYRAIGYDPQWQMMLTPSAIALIMGAENRSITFYRPGPRLWETGRSYRNDQIQIIISNDICEDKQTKLFYPEGVEISYAGNTLKGCGEALAALPEMSQSSHREGTEGFSPPPAASSPPASQ